jgi:hypothetical protein
MKIKGSIAILPYPNLKNIILRFPILPKVLKMTTKKTYIFTTMILSLLLPTNAICNEIKDSDLDGVPDSIDICPHTPFLNEVDKNGCTTKILTLPQESDTTNLTLSIGYGYNTNDDLVGQSTQHLRRVQLSYYHDSWLYTLTTAYYTYDGESGMQDTTLKIKKRWRLNPTLKLTVGAGLKLPTYDFKGNHTDYILYTSLNYYATSKLSYFGGLNYTFVQDDALSTPLRNSYSLYIGSGYFFTKKFYANLAYSFGQNKFTNEHTTHTLGTTLYYKIDKRLFSTLTYQREIGDEDLHDGLSIKLGAKIW